MCRKCPVLSEEKYSNILLLKVQEKFRILFLRVCGGYFERQDRVFDLDVENG